MLEISRATFYKYRSTVDKDYQDYLLINEVFKSTKQMYGYRRLKKAILIQLGWRINHKKLLRLMNKYGLTVRYKSVYKRNYMKKYLAENAKENLLKGDFSADKDCEKWVTDITYLSYQNKHLYLSTIIDLYSRDIVSYVMSNRNDVKLVKDTLEKAIENRKDVQGTILHSDQGFQYTSYEYKALCESHGITISMNRKGTPSDNAPIESFHSSLKRETLYSYNITSLEHYKGLVQEWLESYNTTRLRLAE